MSLGSHQGVGRWCSFWRSKEGILIQGSHSLVLSPLHPPTQRWMVECLTLTLTLLPPSVTSEDTGDDVGPTWMIPKTLTISRPWTSSSHLQSPSSQVTWHPQAPGVGRQMWGRTRICLNATHTHPLFGLPPPSLCFWCGGRSMSFRVKYTGCVIRARWPWTPPFTSLSLILLTCNTRDTLSALGNDRREQVRYRRPWWAHNKLCRKTQVRQWVKQDD